MTLLRVIRDTRVILLVVTVDFVVDQVILDTQVAEYRATLVIQEIALQDIRDTAVNPVIVDIQAQVFLVTRVIRAILQVATLDTQEIQPLVTQDSVGCLVTRASRANRVTQAIVEIRD